MSESYQQPYYGYALKKLPKDERLQHQVAKYLYMRISKNKELSVSEWQLCIDELVELFDLSDTTKNKSKTKRIVAHKPRVSVMDLCYYFMVATRRKWNHIYFTHEQDVAWEKTNISYYQDPYWQQQKNDPELRKIMEDQTKKCRNEWKD